MFYPESVSPGTQKWVTLVGAALFMTSTGTLNTFSNLVPYIISYLRVAKEQDVRYADAALGFLVLGILYSVAVLTSSVVVQRGLLSMKTMMFIGIFIISASQFVTYFAVQTGSFLAVLFSLFILYALGNGANNFFARTIAIKWFPKNVGGVTAFLTFGTAIGAVITGQLQTLYINSDNLSPDLPAFNQSKELYFSNIEMLERVPTYFGIAGVMNFIFMSVGFFMIYEKNDTDVRQEETNQEGEVELKPAHVEEEEEKAHAPSKANSMGIVFENPLDGMPVNKAIKSKPFFLMFFILGLSFLAFQTTNGFFKLYGLAWFGDDQFITLTGSAGLIAQAAALPFWGFLAERFAFKINMLIVEALFIIFTASFWFIQNVGVDVGKYLFMLWFVIFNFAHTGTLLFVPTCAAKTFGQRFLPTIYSVVLQSVVIFGLFASALQLFYIELGFLNIFLIGAGCALLAGILILLYDVKKSDGKNV